jgi:hypothetical protein
MQTNGAPSDDCLDLNVSGNGARTFSVCHGVYAERKADGRVKIYFTDGAPPWAGGKEIFGLSVCSSDWASLVLGVSAFGERAGDAEKFLAHHFGVTDVFGAP